MHPALVTAIAAEQRRDQIAYATATRRARKARRARRAAVLVTSHGTGLVPAPAATPVQPPRARPVRPLAPAARPAGCQPSALLCPAARG
jgi:hypothetical protein